MLSLRDGTNAIGFYKAAFGAAELFRVEDGSASLAAQLIVNEAEFWLADESPKDRNSSPESLRVACYESF